MNCFRHTESCRNQSCNRSGCLTTKTLIHHFDSCCQSQSICALCESVIASSDKDDRKECIQAQAEVMSTNPTIPPRTHENAPKLQLPMRLNEETSSFRGASPVRSPSLGSDSVPCFSRIPFKPHRPTHVQAPQPSSGSAVELPINENGHS